ncbi:Immunomodulatory protein Ling Zhi-8 [Trametes pubescens]|uniref:Immunomodulatory protein Ling Zhi-8 n=1 Tax=Trametes pubescens TaxID=154538 RepID=A0A1M2V769_TRAPU|nr:Immunomodulatory protein Ling Zhi-8 [Trametes pubescens]
MESDISAMATTISLLLHLTSTLGKVHFDYTPHWGHGHPNTYIDNVTFPHVLTDKPYIYRVCMDDTDLGMQPALAVQSDGSQKLNFLQWNGGHGIPQTHRIRVYVVDPGNAIQYLVALWIWEVAIRTRG